MAEDAGTLLVKLRADIAELKSQLQEGRNELSGFKGDAEGFGSDLKSALTFAAGALGIYELGSAIKSMFQQGLQAVDDFKLSTIGVAATITDMAVDGSKGQENYTRALSYSKAMFEDLELAAARYFASGKEMTQAWNIMAQKGVVLKNEEIDALGVIVDRIKLSTQGQSSAMQIAQEMRALLTGQARTTDQIGMLLKDRIPNLKEEIAKHREIGDLVVWLGDQFKGLKYASEDIQDTLESQKSTLDTLLTQVGRAGLEGAYADIVEWLKLLNDYLMSHKQAIANDIHDAWVMVREVLLGIVDIYQGISSIAPDFQGLQGLRDFLGDIAIRIAQVRDLFFYLLAGATEAVEAIKERLVESCGTDVTGAFSAGIAAMQQRLTDWKNQAVQDANIVRFNIMNAMAARTTMHIPFMGGEPNYGEPEKRLPDSAPGTKSPGGGGKGGGGGGGGGGGAKSRVSEWQGELEEMKQAEQSFFNFSKQREIEFWREKLAQCSEGSNEYLQVKRKLFTLEAAQAKENLQREIANLKLEQESAKNSGDQRLAIQDQILAKLAATYGKDSKEFIQAETQKIKMLRQLEQERLKMDQDRIQKKAELDKIDLDMERENVQFKTRMGAQSQAQEIAALMKLKQQEFLIERKALTDQIKLWQSYPKEKGKLHNQLQLLEKKHNLEMGKLHNQQTLALKEQWGQLWDSVSRAFTMSLQGIITGTTTLADALKNIWQSIMASIAEMLMQMVLQWIAAQIMGLAFGKTTAMSEVAQEAAVAGAAGFSSVMAALPFPVNVGVAPGVAAAASAQTMAYGALASAAGGWDVPEDSLALIHKNEMVLPASLADNIRQMSGGGKPGVNIEKLSFAPTVVSKQPMTPGYAREIARKYLLPAFQDELDRFGVSLGR